MEGQPSEGAQQVPWRKYLLIGAGVVLVLSWFGGGDDPRATMRAFQDDPSAFKGREVTGKMSYTGAGGRLADDVRSMEAAFLRAPFTVFTDAGSFDTHLLLPRGLRDVPQAGSTDYLSVTFRCNAGELDGGNVVTSIRRY